MPRASLLLVLLLAAAGAPAARAQLLREAPASHGGQTWDLSIRLEPDRIWRQDLHVTTLSEVPGSPVLVWEVEAELRLRCLVREGARWRIEGAFTDWRLRLQEGETRTEWRQGRLRLEGWPAGEETRAAACRRLLAAWSEGLRRVDLRFLVGPDGAIQELRGMEILEELVAGAVGGGKLPPGFREAFGPAGVRRFVTVLEAAISVPRPPGPVRLGEEWSCECAAPGAEPGQVLRRRLRFTGSFRERRHRLLRLELRPELVDADGRLAPAATGRGSLELLADSGLTYRMQVELTQSLPGGGSLQMELLTRHRD